MNDDFELNDDTELSKEDDTRPFIEKVANVLNITTNDPEELLAEVAKKTRSMEAYVRRKETVRTRLLTQENIYELRSEISHLMYSRLGSLILERKNQKVSEDDVLFYLEGFAGASEEELDDDEHDMI